MGVSMENGNLVLKFKLARDRRFRVKRAARIKVDGRGGLVFYDARNGAAEYINLRELQAFCIQPVMDAGQRMAIPQPWIC
jgi:hypothetical protein